MNKCDLRSQLYLVSTCKTLNKHGNNSTLIKSWRTIKSSDGQMQLEHLPYIPTHYLIKYVANTGNREVVNYLADYIKKIYLR